MAEDSTDSRDQQPPAAGPTLEQITPEGTPTVYANNVALRVTVWDFTMHFGILTELSEQRIAAKDVATVIMSPQHAKVFAETLTKIVEQYEEKFGQLPRTSAIEQAEL